MRREYAIQEKTLLDGDFDRLRTGHGPFDSIPYTREEAEELVERQNKRYGVPWMRVVFREVSDWYPL